MTLEISWDENALHDLEKLEIQLRSRIIRKIEQFAIANSFHEIKKLKGYEKTYRLRIGDYRVIFELTEQSMIIIKVGHRKNIYDF